MTLVNPVVQNRYSPCISINKSTGDIVGSVLIRNSPDSTCL